MSDYDKMSEGDKALYDEAIAVKILGGFGARNHMGDTGYALSVNEIQNALAGANAEDIECLIVVAKVRNLKNPEQDRFDIVGGVLGSELELTALHALVAARIRAFRAAIEEKLAQTNGEHNGH